MKNQLNESFNCKFLNDLAHIFNNKIETDNRSMEDYMSTVIDFVTYLSTIAMQLNRGKLDVNDSETCKKVSEYINTVIKKNPHIVLDRPSDFTHTMSQWFNLYITDFMLVTDDIDIKVKSLQSFKDTIDKIGIKNMLNAIRHKMKSTMLDDVDLYVTRKNGTVYSNFRHNMSLFNNFSSLTDWLQHENGFFYSKGIDLNKITDADVEKLETVPKSTAEVKKKYPESLLFWFAPKDSRQDSNTVESDTLTDNDVLVALTYAGGKHNSPFVFSEYFEDRGLSSNNVLSNISFFAKYCNKVYAVTSDWELNSTDLQRKRDERDRNTRVYNYVKLVPADDPDQLAFYTPYINNYLATHNMAEIPVYDELPDPNDPRGNSPDIVKVLKNNTIYTKTKKEDSLKIVVNPNRYERYATYWMWVSNKLSNYKKQVIHLKIVNGKIDKLVENTINGVLNCFNENKFSVLDQPSDDKYGVLENSRILLGSIASIMNIYKKEYLPKFKNRYIPGSDPIDKLDSTSFKDIEKNIMNYVNKINEIIDLEYFTEKN